MVVEVREILGQNVLEVAAVDDQFPVLQFAADRSDPSLGDPVRSAIPFARGARTGVRRMRMPSPVKTGSKTSVNLLPRSRIKNLKGATRSPRSISKLCAC